MNPDLNEIHKLLLRIPSGYDMTLCPGTNCPHRFLCLRYLAEALGRQDYFGSAPISASGECASYLDARPAFQHALNPDLIRQMAHELSVIPFSYSDLNWLYIETKLQLDQLYDGKMGSIPRERIQYHAYLYSKSNQCTFSEMHWLIAEQNLLYKAIKFQISLREKKRGN
jgi:hypothetical protein